MPTTSEDLEDDIDSAHFGVHPVRPWMTQIPQDYLAIGWLLTALGTAVVVAIGVYQGQKLRFGINSLINMLAHCQNRITGEAFTTWMQSVSQIPTAHQIMQRCLPKLRFPKTLDANQIVYATDDFASLLRSQDFRVAVGYPRLRATWTTPIFVIWSALVGIYGSSLLLAKLPGGMSLLPVYSISLLAMVAVALGASALHYSITRFVIDRIQHKIDFDLSSLTQLLQMHFPFLSVQQATLMTLQDHRELTDHLLESARTMRFLQSKNLSQEEHKTVARASQLFRQGKNSVIIPKHLRGHPNPGSKVEPSTQPRSNRPMDPRRSPGPGQTTRRY